MLVILNEYSYVFLWQNNIPINLFFIVVSWPQGKYTLVKPTSGCPTGWVEGWRLQDNEDDKGNINSVSSGHHFYGNQILIY